LLLLSFIILVCFDCVFHQSILDKTPPGHIDHDDLVAAHEAVVKLICEVNEEKRAKENKDRFTFLLGAIDFGSAATQTFVQQIASLNPNSGLCEGTVNVIEVSGNKLKKRKPLHIVIAGGLVLLSFFFSSSSYPKKWFF